MKDTKSSAMRNSVDPSYTTNSPSRSNKKSKKSQSPSPLSKSKTSANLNGKGMIINLKQTPSKDDDGIFKENNIKKVNIQEFQVESENYTLEGISGMVLME
jgi:hypothetical protein